MSISRYHCYRLFRLAFILTLGLAGLPLLANDSLDHLVPSDGIIKPTYEKLLRRKLYLTPADYIRIAVLPSTGSLGETVYSFRPSSKSINQATLTYTHAENNLWAEASDSNGALTIEPKAKGSTVGRTLFEVSGNFNFECDRQDDRRKTRLERSRSDSRRRN